MKSLDSWSLWNEPSAHLKFWYHRKRKKSCLDRDDRRMVASGSLCGLLFRELSCQFQRRRMVQRSTKSPFPWTLQKSQGNKSHMIEKMEEGLFDPNSYKIAIFYYLSLQKKPLNFNSTPQHGKVMGSARSLLHQSVFPSSHFGRQIIRWWEAKHPRKTVINLCYSL